MTWNEFKSKFKVSSAQSEDGCTLLRARHGQRGIAVPILVGAEIRAELISAAQSGVTIELGDTAYRLVHNPAGQAFTDSNGVQRMRTTDMFALVSGGSTYDDLQSALEAD